MDATIEIKNYKKKKIKFNKLIIKCYNYYKKGYYARECKSPKKGRQIKVTSYNKEIKYDDD